MKAFFSLLMLLVCSWFVTPLAAATLLDVTDQPTIGGPQGAVQVVAFLEPKCPDSKRYNNNSFPLLKKEYIDTNKIRYSVITASFLQQSMPAALALLCIYHQPPNPPRTDLFFKFLDYIYQHQLPEKDDWATVGAMQEFANKVSPEIDQEHLATCIINGHYREQIIKNTKYGDKLMGHISTPTIFVNGIRVANKDDTIDYDNLKAAIEAALSKKS